MARKRRATVEDVHRLAAAMPQVERSVGPIDNAKYAIRGKHFVIFRTPRPDAVDAQTGERLTDVIVVWVDSETDKLALVDDDSTPFFTTPHFDGYNAVLVRASRIGELDYGELAEVIADAWLTRAPKRLAGQWLADHPDWPAGA